MGRDMLTTIDSRDVELLRMSLPVHAVVTLKEIPLEFSGLLLHALADGSVTEETVWKLLPRLYGAPSNQETLRQRMRWSLRFAVESALLAQNAYPPRTAKALLAVKLDRVHDWRQFIAALGYAPSSTIIGACANVAHNAVMAMDRIQRKASTIADAHTEFWVADQTYDLKYGVAAGMCGRLAMSVHHLALGEVSERLSDDYYEFIRSHPSTLSKEDTATLRDSLDVARAAAHNAIRTAFTRTVDAWLEINAC